MRIVSLTVGGSRNLDRTTIELSGITAVAAPNNYGKSNLFDAIYFGTEFLNASPAVRRRMMSDPSFVPLNPSLENDPYHFEVLLEAPELPAEYRFIRYSYEFAWIRDGEHDGRITDESIEAGPRNSNRLVSFLWRNRGRYRKGKGTRSHRQINLDGDQLAIDILTSIAEAEISLVVREVKKLSFRLMADIDVRRTYVQSPWEFPTFGALPADETDIPRALHDLKMEDPDGFRDFQASAVSLFPDIKSIDVIAYQPSREYREVYDRIVSEDEGEQDVPFRIKDEMYALIIDTLHFNQPVNATMMSSGTQRVLWLVACSIIARAKGVPFLGIEEIEASIHPRMIGTLLEELDEGLGDTGLLVSSHSPYLIQYLKPQSVYLAVPTDDGTAAFRRLSKAGAREAADMAYDHGMGLGEYLFDMMSSDEEEAAKIARWLEA